MKSAVSRVHIQTNWTMHFGRRRRRPFAVKISITNDGFTIENIFLQWWWWYSENIVVDVCV